jgi:hypothetical protein
MPGESGGRPVRGGGDGWISRQIEGLRTSGITAGLRERIRSLFAPGSRVGQLTSGVSRETRRFTSSFMPRLDRIRLDGFVNRLGRMAPRNINISAPRVNLSNVGPGRVSLGSGGGLGALAAIVLALAAAGILFFALARKKGWVGGPAGDGWKLGAWPVDPKAVRTRDDVVKAFEYLALLLLGRKAGSANHLDIASQLASGDDEAGNRGAAARELARVYEHARYAPPQEPLTEREAESARRDLDLLAGVAAA